MRWYAPQEGMLRTRRAFLFWPRYINYETRWLEAAVWTERYVAYLGWCPQHWEES